MTNQPPTGVELIAQERQRQITEKGWTPAHDDQHVRGELALAAIAYAAPEPLYALRLENGTYQFLDATSQLPFIEIKNGEDGFFQQRIAKKRYGSRIRELVVAGSFIAAEIDRLLREVTQIDQQLRSLSPGNQENHE